MMSRSLQPLAVFILAVLLVTGCKDDESAPVSVLGGTWTFKSSTYSNCTDPEDNGNVTTTCNATNCTKWTFAANGRLVASGVDEGDEWEDDDSTYKIKENNKLEICESGGCETMNFQVSGNTLTLSGYEGDESGCNFVLTLSKD